MPRRLKKVHFPTFPTLVSHHDAYISRPGEFCADRQNGLVSPLHMHEGNYRFCTLTPLTASSHPRLQTPLVCTCNIKRGQQQEEHTTTTPRYTCGKEPANALVTFHPRFASNLNHMWVDFISINASPFEVTLKLQTYSTPHLFHTNLTLSVPQSHGCPVWYVTEDMAAERPK